jgi:hypothetical protein
MHLNVSVQSSVDVPTSITKALDETVQIEYSKQLQQLQYEFKALQRWLDVTPQGLQARGASRKMQNRFKGDRPVGDENTAANAWAPKELRLSESLVPENFPAGNSGAPTGTHTGSGTSDQVATPESPLFHSYATFISAPGGIEGKQLSQGNAVTWELPLPPEKKV